MIDMKKFWCEPLKITTLMASCNLRRSNPEINECTGCPGPVEMKGKDEGGRMKDEKIKKDVSVTLPEARRCKAEGCEKTINNINKSGFCRSCRMKLQGADMRRKALLATRKTRKKKAKGNVVTVDFSNHPELLNSLRFAAREDFRSIEQQVLHLAALGLKVFSVQLVKEAAKEAGVELSKAEVEKVSEVVNKHIQE